MITLSDPRREPPLGRRNTNTEAWQNILHWLLWIIRLLDLRISGFFAMFFPFQSSASQQQRVGCLAAFVLGGARRLAGGYRGNLPGWVMGVDWKVGRSRWWSWCLLPSSLPPLFLLPTDWPSSSLALPPRSHKLTASHKTLVGKWLEFTTLLRDKLNGGL